jgi:hypothetical protein
MPTPKTPSRAKRAPDPPNEIQVFGGRMLIAAGMLVAIGMLAPKYLQEAAERYTAKFETVLDRTANQDQWKPNQSVEVGITLIAADYDKLACAYDKPVGGVHCQYKNETELWPADPNAPLDNNKKDVIQPFSLVPDNQLILLAGIWAQPAVGYRIHQEPDSIAQKRQARFIATCRIRPIERVQNVSIRWNSGSAWGKATVVVPNEQDQVPWVAVAEHCTVAEQ